MMQVTFDNIPQILQNLVSEIGELKSTILNLKLDPKEEWTDIEGICKYLPDKPSVPTIYRKVSNREIPHTKRGKKLSFHLPTINKWLLDGSVKTMDQIKQDASENI